MGFLCFIYEKRVREHIPLKQGLRLLAFSSVETAMAVREHIPLKQGLRL